MSVDETLQFNFNSVGGGGGGGGLPYKKYGVVSQKFSKITLKGTRIFP